MVACLLARCVRGTRNGRALLVQLSLRDLGGRQQHLCDIAVVAFLCFLIIIAVFVRIAIVRIVITGRCSYVGRNC